MSAVGEPKGQGLQTLSRGLKLLEAMVATAGSATAKSLARQLSLRQSTCYEMLKTLELSGYVARTGAVAGSLAVSTPVTRLTTGERAIADLVMACAYTAGYLEVPRITAA